MTAGPDALSALIIGIAQTMHADDSPELRAQAAAQIEQLRELLAHADPVRDGDRPALLDVARLGEALRVLAEGLRDPTNTDRRSRQAMAELEAAAGPLISALEVHDDEAQLARHRQDASDAIDSYFGEHPIAPFEL